MPPSERNSIQKTARILKWSVLVLFLILVILPSISGFIASQPSPPEQLISTFEQLQKFWLWGFGLFAAIWTFFLGGCFASFLNVVAWRLPQGKTLLGKSHCPSCGATLSLKENMPLIGWMDCGGVSRCCGLPIPSRYFWVEFFLGSIFVLIIGLEIGLQGINLPDWMHGESRPRNMGTFPTHLFWWTGLHLSLISILFTCSLFRFEGDRIPLPFFLFGVLWMGGIYVAMLTIDSHSAKILCDWLPMLKLACGGLFAGLVLGSLLSLLTKFVLNQHGLADLRNDIFCGALTGLGLGLTLLPIAGVIVLLSLGALRVLGQFGQSSGWMSATHRWFAATLLTLLLSRLVDHISVLEPLQHWIFS
ncbi:MAG: prepilin peptidase [Pirellulaceae bacterium]